MVLRLPLLLTLSTCACSSTTVRLMGIADAGGTSTGGSTTGGTSSGSTSIGTSSTGGSTGGTSAGLQPVTVTLHQTVLIGCSDGCAGVFLQLASGGPSFAPHDFDCPPDAMVESGCCIAPLSSFQGRDAGCSGSAAVPFLPDGSVEVDPAAGCTADIRYTLWQTFPIDSPAEIAGTTSEGASWEAAVTLPSSFGTFHNGAPLPCPVLSLSMGSVIPWTPTSDALTHAVMIDASIDGGQVFRIACSVSEDPGTIAVPSTILGLLAGATTVDITTDDVTDLISDAGETPIDIRAETRLENPYASDFGLCMVSP